MMEPVIRRATPSDYESLCALFAEADQLHRDHLPAWFQSPDGPARDKAFILNLLADDTARLFVAERDGTLVGLVQAALRETPPVSIFVPRRYAVVDTLVVKTAFRQQGIGQKLMDAVQGWAVSMGAGSVELNVYEFNQAAIGFYRKLGYGMLSRKMGKLL